MLRLCAVLAGCPDSYPRSGYGRQWNKHQHHEQDHDDVLRLSSDHMLAPITHYVAAAR